MKIKKNLSERWSYLLLNPNFCGYTRMTSLKDVSGWKCSVLAVSVHRCNGKRARSQSVVRSVSFSLSWSCVLISWDSAITIRRSFTLLLNISSNWSLLIFGTEWTISSSARPTWLSGGCLPARTSSTYTNTWSNIDDSFVLASAIWARSIIGSTPPLGFATAVVFRSWVFWHNCRATISGS